MRTRLGRIEFLRSIWDVHPSGSWLFLAVKQGPHWIEHPVRKDKNLGDNLRDFFKEFPARKHDLYFCPNAFSSRKRRTASAIKTPYAWCDIDEADPHRFIPPPGILWESSPGRYQGLWVFEKRLSPRHAERLSKYLAYEFNGDQNGWSVTKVLRIPGTYNHKRDGKPPRVKLLGFDTTRITAKPLLALAPKLQTADQTIVAGSFDLDRDPIALFRKHFRKIKHDKARMLLRQRRVFLEDRSRQIFIMIAGLVQADVPWNDIACLIWHSPYFRSKHGPNFSALEAEIQRAMNKFDTGGRDD